MMPFDIENTMTDDSKKKSAEHTSKRKYDRDRADHDFVDVYCKCEKYDRIVEDKICLQTTINMSYECIVIEKRVLMHTAT